MKPFLLFAGFALFLSGCKDKGSSQSGPPAESREAAASTGDPGAGPSSPSIKSEATPEQLGATARVRVIAGGLPPKSYTGAILHRDELPDTGTYFDENRCVLALLDGWNEKQLRSPQCRFLIFRNLPDSSGEVRVASYPGRLLQFDAKTGIAAIGYRQGFSAETDVGFQIDRTGGIGSDGIALRTLGSTAMAASGAGSEVDGRGSPSTRGLGSLEIEPGRFQSASGETGSAAFSSNTEGRTRDLTPILVKAPMQLAGFLRSGEGNTVSLVRLGGLKVELSQQGVKPVSVGFSGNQGRTTLVIHVSPTGTEKPSNISLLSVPLKSGDNPDLATFREPYSAIQDKSPQRISPYQGDETQFQASLVSPTTEGGEMAYLLQLGWPAFPGETKPAMYSAPFIVRFTRKGGGIVTATEGIENLNQPKPRSTDKATAPQSFDLPAPVQQLFEIAGGREVLFQFQGEPFWKRFSMERKEWLPLPAGLHFASVDIAGNLNSLFVLERGSGTVKRFKLSDLSQVASAKLDSNYGPYLTIRAGCNSDLAPVHILGDKGTSAIAADTLVSVDAPFNAKLIGRRFSQQLSVGITGDGLSLISGFSGSSDAYMTFAGNIWGMRPSYFGAPDHARSAQPSVSAAYAFQQFRVETCANTSGTWTELRPPGKNSTLRFCAPIPNAPITVSLEDGDRSLIPPLPPRIKLHSLIDTESFAEIEAPEVEELVSPYLTELRSFRASYEPESGNLGVISRDLKRWVVFPVRPTPKQGQQVLLNWPDSTVVRGQEFRFAPQFGGAEKFEAELIGTKEPTPMTREGGVISFKLAENEFASLLLLNLKLLGREGGNSVISIPLHVQGAPIAYIASDADVTNDTDYTAASFKSLGAPKTHQLGLKSTFFGASPEVKEVCGPISGYLAFVTSRRTIDFYSLKSMAIANSIPAADKADYYDGGGALFEYNSEARTLTRIRVPEGIRERAFTVPENFHLRAFSVGSQPADPMTLVIERLENGRAGRLGPYPFVVWDSSRAMLVVNSETFQANGWAQPQFWTDKSDVNRWGNAFFSLGMGDDLPKRLVGSRNGQILALPNHLMVVSPRLSMAIPYPGGEMHGLYGERASGSITGYVVATRSGHIFRNGVSQGQGYGRYKVSPCGRYRLTQVDGRGNGTPPFEIRTIEGNHLLFRLNRIAALDHRFEGDQIPSEISLVGDAGPLMIKAKGGRQFQFIDFDIPRLAALIEPNSFHVTSQPMPCVIEGGTYEYQVQVNQPELVGGYRLRTSVPNATISPSGLLRYGSPPSIKAPEKVTFSIEIGGKNDQSVLHEFDIFVVPRMIPSAPKTAPLGGRAL